MQPTEFCEARDKYLVITSFIGYCYTSLLLFRGFALFQALFLRFLRVFFTLFLRVTLAFLARFKLLSDFTWQLQIAVRTHGLALPLCQIAARQQLVADHAHKVFGVIVFVQEINAVLQRDEYHTGNVYSFMLLTLKIGSPHLSHMWPNSELKCTSQ